MIAAGMHWREAAVLFPSSASVPYLSKAAVALAL